MIMGERPGLARRAELRAPSWARSLRSMEAVRVCGMSHMR